MNPSNFPEWFGTAVIAAVFASLGFLGRNILELIEKRHSKKEDAIRQVEKL